ncbi:uncharacterized protein [Ciconia boyciana]|uniref:uncharacterized protein n=1 Tax=Ciconia boyciana TaxID=52775 RepID=UPI003BA3463C
MGAAGRRDERAGGAGEGRMRPPAPVYPPGGRQQPRAPAGARRSAGSLVLAARFSPELTLSLWLPGCGSSSSGTGTRRRHPPCPRRRGGAAAATARNGRAALPRPEGRYGPPPGPARRRRSPPLWPRVRAAAAEVKLAIEPPAARRARRRLASSAQRPFAPPSWLRCVRRGEPEKVKCLEAPKLLSPPAWQAEAAARLCLGRGRPPSRFLWGAAAQAPRAARACFSGLPRWAGGEDSYHNSLLRLYRMKCHFFPEFGHKEWIEEVGTGITSPEWCSPGECNQMGTFWGSVKLSSSILTASSLSHRLSLPFPALQATLFHCPGQASSKLADDKRSLLFL